MNEFKLCPNCPNIHIEKLKALILSLDSSSTFVIECVNMCGICQQKAFLIMNGIPIICDTEDELIVKLKEKMSN